MSFTQPTPLVEGLRDMDVADLHESDDNPRYITQEAMELLKHSIENDPDMLKARPVIADEWGIVICGNMRLRAATELGKASVPTFVKHFRDEGEKREWMLRDNAAYGEWVPDQVAQIVLEHQQQGGDLLMLGMDDEAIAAAIRRATGEAIVVPTPSESPNPTLDSECMVEIRCDRDGLQIIQTTLEAWQESVPNLSVAVTQ